MWLFLRDLSLSTDARILHLAPEKGLYEALSRKVSSGSIHATDIDPRRYAHIPGIQRLDLCDLDEIPSDSYDLIVHSHVLEHVPCNIAYPLYHLHRALKPDGWHICVIPFMPGRYDETFDDIGDAERTRRFGQFDHVRRFGRDDIPRHLGAVLDLSRHVDALDVFAPEELQEANIPLSSGRGFSIDTVLRLRKFDMRFLGDRALEPTPA
jgi:SAM-dependent methyltransferase